MDDRALPRKLTFRAHGRTLVLDKRPGERPEHRIMMALLWARYLPRYPQLRIDVPIGARYRPDLVQLDAAGRPELWGECGAVGLAKLRDLCGRYRATHLVFARWGGGQEPFAALIERAAREARRSAPIELLGYDDQALDAIGPDGAIGAAEPLHQQRWG